jgi:RHS repeat-associated protein
VTVDGKGNVLSNADYYPFGSIMPGRAGNISLSNDRVKFTGYLLEEEGGQNTYHAEARGYDPVIGRFTSRDPLFGKYPSISPYAYVLNNPINAIDPDGEDVWFVHGTFSDPDFMSQDTRNEYTSALQESVQHSFNWISEANNTPIGRVNAAFRLAEDIAIAYKTNPSMLVQIVAHSHGGNVAIMAANILRSMDVPVHYLYLLGTPARESYTLQKGAVKNRAINISHSNDWIQTLLGGIDFVFNPLQAEIQYESSGSFRSEDEFTEVLFIGKDKGKSAHSFQNKEDLIIFIEYFIWRELQKDEKSNE